MILPRVQLSQHPADARSVVSEDDEQVVNLEPNFRQLVDDLDMRESLSVRANLVLALHDQYAARFQNPERLCRSPEVQVEDGFMVFLGRVDNPVVVVIMLVVLVVLMRRPPGCVHVGRVENDTVNHPVAIWQLPAVNTGGQVGGANVVCSGFDVLPEHTLAIRDIGNETPRRHVQRQDVREYVVVRPLIGGKDEFICCDATRNPVCFLGSNDHGALTDHGS